MAGGSLTLGDLWVQAGVRHPRRGDGVVRALAGPPGYPAGTVLVYFYAACEAILVDVSELQLQADAHGPRWLQQAREHAEAMSLGELDGPDAHE